MDEPLRPSPDRNGEPPTTIRPLLRSRWVSFIYITTKMDEVFNICDEVTVLRDGRYVGTNPIQALSHDLLIQKMVGRELDLPCSTGRRRPSPAPIPYVRELLRQAVSAR